MARAKKDFGEESPKFRKKIQAMLDEGKFKLGSDELPPQQWIDSGSVVLNYAMGGGYPVGKIVEIFGKESCGKSLLTLVAEANVTQQKKYVLHCDLEDNHSTSDLNKWREAFGVDMDYVLTIPQGPAEEIVNKTLEILKEMGKDIPLMVVDSLGYFLSEKTLAKEAQEATMAIEARIIRRWLGQLTHVCQNTCIILLNHTIAKLSYGGGEETKGGGGPRFYSSIRLDVKGTKVIDPTDPLIGATAHEMKVHVKKSKITTPGRIGELLFDYRSMSFDKITEIIQLGKKIGIIQSKPPMYSFDYQGETVKTKGKEALRVYLQENPEAMEYLRKEIFK